MIINGCALPTQANQDKNIVVQEEESFDKKSKQIIQPRSTSSFKEMRLFPNPTNGDLTVEFVIAQAAQVQLFITDLSGKRMMNKIIQADAGKQNVQFDASRLKEGYYFIQVISQGTRIQEKFVVIK